MRSYKMRLTDSAMASLTVAKVFTENDKRINAIDCSADGTHLVCSSDDDMFLVYDCAAGVMANSKPLYSKKYGMAHIRFAQQGHASAVHASTKVDFVLRQVSLHDNKYIRYFRDKPHEAEVTDLAMSPTESTFISAAADKSIRLWDLRSEACQGCIPIPTVFHRYASHSNVAIDPQGLVFAAGISSEVVRFFDFKTFDKGPFKSCPVPQAATSTKWTGLKFSPDGHLLLISTNANLIYLLDAFSGHLMHTLKGHSTSACDLPLEACFTPDSKYVLSGSADGFIHVWSAERGNFVARLSAQHKGPVFCCQFNPKFAMLATGSGHLAFSIPTEDD